MLLGAVSAGCQSPSFQSGIPLGTNQAAGLTECSGLAASRRNPHVLWAHNDSGHAAELYALTRGGALLCTYSISGAVNEDWEDLALGADPTSGVHQLFIGDIGDNTASRSAITVYRVPEPIVDTNSFNATGTLSSDAFTLAYPLGPRDAETLMQDPWTGDLFIVSKAGPSSRVYRCAYPPSASGTNLLEFMRALPYGTAVGGDVSPSGRQILIKTYFLMRYYDRTNGQTVSDALGGSATFVPTEFEPQGEAVCWQGREAGYFTLSENAAQPVYFHASADGDQDGLADSAEIAAGSDMTDADSDGDGLNDGNEVIAGTDPTNSAATFAVANVTAAMDRVSISWEARSNRLYSVQRAAATNANAYEGFADVTVSEDGVYTTNFPAGSEPEFFRVTVRDASGW